MAKLDQNSRGYAISISNTSGVNVFIPHRNWLKKGQKVDNILKNLAEQSPIINQKIKKY